MPPWDACGPQDDDPPPHRNPGDNSFETVMAGTALRARSASLRIG